MRTALFVALLAICGTASLSYGADSDAILEALQKLNSRLDGMQDGINGLRSDVDRLKGGSVASPANAQSSRAPVSMQTVPPKERFEPGWVINVFPYNGEADPVKLLRFPNSKNPLTLSDHQKIRRIDHRVYYKGSGKLNIYNDGAHAFEVEVTNPNAFYRCYVTLSVDGRDLISRAEVRGPSGQVTIKNSKIDLKSGNYDVDFKFSCYENDWDSWGSAQIQFKIMGPDDNISRNITGKDLFHVVTGAGASPLPPAASEPSDQPPTVMVGTTRTVIADVNVRESSSTSAAVATKLLPGQSVRVVKKTSDNEWVQVEVSGRVAGFVKASAFAMNTK